MDIQQFLGEGQMIRRLYDVVRVVDPVTKEVLESVCFGGYEAKLQKKLPMTYCHQFWGDDQGVCENCSSTRALLDKQVHMKTEFDGQEVYMVTSLPIESDGKMLIFEAVVDVTDKELLNELKGKDYFEIRRILRQRNLEMVRDPLTGAYNRRFIEERLPFELLDAKQSDRPTILAMADIDHFKHINDTYGHDAGDAVLREFVQVISDRIRAHVDWIARYGGEEFVIFLKGIEPDLAYEKLEQIREAVATHPFVCGEEEIRVTSSFGMSLLQDEDTVHSCIKRADQGLYRAKSEGRNRITEVTCA